MEAFEDSCWNELDYCMIDQASDFCWNFSSGATLAADVVDDASADKAHKRRREQKATCHGESKADREKLRREKINDRFLELSSVLHPDQPAKTDKSAILADAIRTFSKLRAEAQELKEKKIELQEEIKNLKTEKNKLRQEKIQLKLTKDNAEQQVKAMSVAPPGYPPAQTAIYSAIPNKVMAYPSYAGFPMWQWLSPAAVDTSHDHVLRPPVA